MESQNTDTILMIEPVAFGFNAETAVNNHFQVNADNASSVITIQLNALAEFNTMVNQLSKHDIKVMTVKDTAQPHTPDSIFPNNWISTHASGEIVIYPMFAPNRRLERRKDIIQLIEEVTQNKKRPIKDYSIFEKKGRFLEGTGSMVLDRENKIAYAAQSERTDKALFLEFCNDLKYKPVLFSSFQSFETKRVPVYHTNVMMSVADQYAVVCLDSIDDKKEKETLIEVLQGSGKEMIEISETQMGNFAGNMLQVKNIRNEKFLVLSDAAFKSLTHEQKTKLQSYNELLIISVPTIEKHGGGSVRCMMCEIF